MNFRNKALINAAAGAAHNAARHLALAQARPEDDITSAWINLGNSQREACINGTITLLEKNHTPEQSHDSWAQHLLAAGWRVGPKNVQERTHPGLVPYAELDFQLKARNEVYCGVAKLIAANWLSVDQS